jgi:hypothetical protein
MVHGRLAGACAGDGPTAFKQRAVAEGVGAHASPQGEQRVRQGIDPPWGGRRIFKNYRTAWTP